MYKIKKYVYKINKAIYERHKEFGIGRFSPEGIARVNELARLKYQRKKAEKAAEKAAEVVVAV